LLSDGTVFTLEGHVIVGHHPGISERIVPPSTIHYNALRQC